MRVGELVTWPKLHIIENRYRLEKQIFLGRQAIRRAMRTRTQERTKVHTEAEPKGQLPSPDTGTKLGAPQIALALSNDSPLPMDSDVEAAYVNGNGVVRPPHRERNHSRRSTQTPHIGRSPTPSSQDIRRAFAARRRWPVNHSPEGDSGDDIPRVDYGRATPDPPPEHEPEQPEPQEPMLQLHPSSLPASPSALFKRLRNASFSPFASMRQRNSRGSGNSVTPQDYLEVEPDQSSESSTDDDDLSILSRRVWAPSSIGVAGSDDDDDDIGGGVDRD